MKKILVITPYFYPHVGGSERYMENLYAYLVKKNPNISVDVLCYNTEKVKSKEKYKGMTVHRLTGFEVLKDQFCLTNPISVAKFISGRKYDLIHTSTRFFDSSWWAVPYAKITKTRLIMTDHCAYHPVSKNPLVNFCVHLIESTIVKESLKFYDKVFAENKATKEFLKREFNVDSIVAYPGIDQLKAKNSKLKANKRLNIVYVGRLIESKGVMTLVDLAKELPDYNFLLAGDGVLKSSIINQKSKNLTVLGNINSEEVKELLSKTDIFVYPSWHSEGLPLALVEAGSKGVAILATDAGAIKELIKDKKTGILVEQKNKNAFKIALIKLTKDARLRQKLGRNLQDFVKENFNWNKASSLVLRELQ